MDSRFPKDYFTARDRFRQAAVRLGCDVEEHPISARGPQGEALTIDVAIAPGADPKRALVVSSGIHGVEGFLGSAIQCCLLEDWQDAPPPIRCVLLHALNPFGFAWRRRVNEANVDVNRNLLLQDEGFSGSPGLYAELDGILNPKRGPSVWDPLAPKLLAALLRHGMPALKQALAAGQYEYPQGLFYGGARPSQTNETLCAHYDRWLGGAHRAMHLDFHTGLGDWGTSKLLIDQRLSAAQSKRLSDWFGSDSFEVVSAAGRAYAARGTLGQWSAARNPARDTVYAAAEFGTYGLVRVLAGLRAENQAHHWCDAEDAALEQARLRLVELFCPRSEQWRSSVLEAGRRIVAQAIGGLSAAGPVEGFESMAQERPG
jgi:Protein of unknown function (DUF2817)